MVFKSNIPVVLNIKYKIHIMQSDTPLYFIKLYYIIIPLTCFGPICRAIFRLIFRQVECTIVRIFIGRYETVG